MRVTVTDMKIGKTLQKIREKVIIQRKYYPFSRSIMNNRIESFIEIKKITGDFLEIGGFAGHQKTYAHGYENYTTVNIHGPADSIMDGHYLAFRDNVFDFVIIDQVLEHVHYPAKVLQESYRVLKKYGYIVVGTPMLVPIHAAPHDFWRFTPSGLEILMKNAGFSNISTYSWGNKLAVREYLNCTYKGTNSHKKWVKLLKAPNDPEFPIVCWGFGQRI